MSEKRSPDDLQAEWEQIKAEMAADRKFIAQSRALIAEGRRLYADCLNRVLASRKLIQRR